MGSPPSDSLGPARPTPGYAAYGRDYVPPAPEPDVRRQPIVRHLVLFAATLLMTTYVGTAHYYGFRSDFGDAVRSKVVRLGAATVGPALSSPIF